MVFKSETEKIKKLLVYIGLILTVLIAGCTSTRMDVSETIYSTDETVSPAGDTNENTDDTINEALLPDRDGWYTSKEDVSLFLYSYGCLPDNFITKNEARKLGWSGGGLDSYMDGGCIGGDKFGNFEGSLPDADGRQYYECDIDTMHESSRGAKRIVFSNDGLIYYTGDHYNTFELLYDDAVIYHNRGED